MTTTTNLPAAHKHSLLKVVALAAIVALAAASVPDNLKRINTSVADTAPTSLAQVA